MWYSPMRFVFLTHICSVSSPLNNKQQCKWSLLPAEHLLVTAFRIHHSLYPPDRYYCLIAVRYLFPEHWMNTKQTIIYAYLKLIGRTAVQYYSLCYCGMNWAWSFCLPLNIYTVLVIKSRYFHNFCLPTKYCSV